MNKGCQLYMVSFLKKVQPEDGSRWTSRNMHLRDMTKIHFNNCLIESCVCYLFKKFSLKMAADGRAETCI